MIRATSRGMFRTMAAVPLLLAAASASALEDAHAPLYLEAGLAYFGKDVREVTTARGMHIGFGYVSPDPALLMQTGFGGVDMDWRRASHGSNRIDTIAVCYTERAYGVIGDLYIGYGLGSAFTRLERHTTTANGVDKAWRVAAKGMIGYVIGGGVIIETAYHYAGKVGGLSAGGFTASAGIWF